uniref:(northern house mosquito) hypothetical protein n=1 Tax=Culex pipiens TaxID=7175 RepID=A0A8D8B532_CULPI
MARPDLTILPSFSSTVLWTPLPSAFSSTSPGLDPDSDFFSPPKVPRSTSLTLTSVNPATRATSADTSEESPGIPVIPPAGTTSTVVLCSTTLETAVGCIFEGCWSLAKKITASYLRCRRCLST